MKTLKDFLAETHDDDDDDSHDYYVVHNTETGDKEDHGTEEGAKATAIKRTKATGEDHEVHHINGSSDTIRKTFVHSKKTGWKSHTHYSGQDIDHGDDM